MITLLDYGAGNVRSVVNAIERLGETVKTAVSPNDIVTAERLVFPGVGAFGNMMQHLHEKRFCRTVKGILKVRTPFFWHLPGDACPF